MAAQCFIVALLFVLGFAFVYVLWGQTAFLVATTIFFLFGLKLAQNLADIVPLREEALNTVDDICFSFLAGMFVAALLGAALRRRPTFEEY